MLIISLIDINQEFWPHFRCSQRKVTIFSLSIFGALEEVIVKTAFTSIFGLNFCQSPRSSPLIWLLSLTEASNQTYLILRRPNTVFARTFADAIHTRIAKTNMLSIFRNHYRYIYLKPALSALFFSIIDRSVLMALVCYYKDMLEKVTKNAKNPSNS